MKIEQALALIEKLQIENQILTEENNDLKKEQKEFQDVLILKIMEIEKLGFWQKIGKYWALLTDLINTIKLSIDQVNANKK